MVEYNGIVALRFIQTRHVHNSTERLYSKCMCLENQILQNDTVFVVSMPGHVVVRALLFKCGQRKGAHFQVPVSCRTPPLFQLSNTSFVLLRLEYHANTHTQVKHWANQWQSTSEYKKVFVSSFASLLCFQAKDLFSLFLFLFVFFYSMPSRVLRIPIP